MAKPIPWSSDRTVDKSSLRVLLDWILEGDNYVRWTHGRIAKTLLCDEILRLMHAQGISYRKEADVRAKIWALEKNMAIAKKLLAQKGLHGVFSLKDCEESVKNRILRRCAYFDELARVMLEPNANQLEQDKPKRGRPRLISTRSERQVNESTKTAASNEFPEASTGAPENQTPAAAAAGNLITLQRMEIQERIDQQRRKHQIELRKVQLEFEAANIQSQAIRERCKMELLAARAIERQKMCTAGIQPTDVDRLVPEA